MGLRLEDWVRVELALAWDWVRVGFGWVWVCSVLCMGDTCVNIYMGVTACVW